jgi:hypothetical protein
VFDDDAQSEPLTVPARVVWCTTLEEGFQIGVAFKPMNAEMAKYLSMFLHYLDDSRPAKKAAKGTGTVDDRFR